MGSGKKDLSPRSWLVAAGRDGGAGAPLNVPLVPASNFVLGTDRSYSRGDGTPTWEALEGLVGGLEGGHAVAFSSGMAAIAAVFEQLATGARVVFPDDCYHGVVGVAEAGRDRRGWRLERLDVEDTANWIAAAGEADLLWLESPTNPLLLTADLAAICAAERKAGAIVAVDNTFATPLNQRPLELGADVSVHSATKFIGGHSDLLSGVAVTASPELEAKLRDTRTVTGATPGALETYLAVRGARTMAVRLEQGQENAAVLAERLAVHPKVERVRYPGLPSHRTHEVAREQLGGYGAIVTFDVAGGATAADEVCRRVRLISHATSLGGVESTMERRAAIHGEEHLPPGLLRLSVGIEDAEDLWRDLERALGAGV